MATAGEGPSAAPSSGYGEGAGVGGKFRKRPFRKTHATPYDRPPTALRNPSWLSKLVLEPASKLFASSAQRFFSPLLRKRLPPPPPLPPPPELDQDSIDGQPETVQKLKQAEAQEAAAGDREIFSRSPGNGGISDLEQLLRKQTFTRSEVDRLTELLRSRAVDTPLEDDVRRAEANNANLVANSGRQQQYLASPLEEKRSQRDRSYGLISTPGVSARVLEEDIASPAEIAKAYMGNQASKVSPSMLGLRTQAIREDTALLSNVSFTPKSTLISLPTKVGAHVEVPENGYTTPRSLGRSAIHNMARTPYSRVHRTAFEKGSGSRAFGGPLLPSPSVKEPDGELLSNRMALKRRSSALDDDDLGSVGPMRRTRQKPSMLSHKTFLPQGIGVVSASRQHPVTDERAYKGPKVIGESHINRTPRTSYAHVPPKSSEMASKILEHLEKMTPKAKSAELKLIAAKEKSPAKLTTDMLRGQALKSLEDAGSSKLLHSDLIGDKLEAGSPSKQVSCWVSTQEKDKIEENGLLKLDSQSNVAARAGSSDVTTSVKGTFTSVEASDSVTKLVAQRPQKKQAFMMSAPEDSLDLDDDTNFNGPASEVLPKSNSNLETAANQYSASGENSLLNKVPALSEIRTPAEPISDKCISDKTTNLESGDAANVSREKASTFSIFSIVSNATSTLVTTVPSSPADNPKQASDKVLESEKSSLQSVADHSDTKPWFLMHPKPETLSRSDGVATSVTDASVKIPGSEKGTENNLQEAVITNGKLGTLHSVALSSTSSGSVSSIVSNGPPAVSPSIFSSTAASASTGLSNSFLTNGTSNLASSASTASSAAATLVSATSSSVPFSSTEEASFPKMPIFNSGSSSNPSISAVSAFSVATAETPVTKTGKEANTGNSSNLLFATTSFATAGTGSSIFGLSSKSTSASSTAVSQSQDSLTSSSNVSILNAQSSVAGSRTATEGMPVQFGSSASSPIFGTSGVVSFTSNNTLFSSLTTAAKPFGPGTDSGPSSSASLSETKSFGPGGGATVASTVFGFHANTPPFSFGGSSTATASVTNAISSSSAAASIFPIGGSSTVNMVSSSSGSSTGIFGVSPLPSSAENNPTSSSSATTGIFGGSWQVPKSSPFSSSPSTGFPFGGSASFGSANTAPMVFGPSTGGSLGSVFPFTTASVSTSSTQSPFSSQPVFGNSAPSFTSAAGNNDQMNTEDSMAEDPVQSSMSAAPVFGQQPVPPSPGGFMFSSTVQSQTSPFQFGGQQNQTAPQNTPHFQASGSQEFGSAGGSFSLGSGGVGGDKSGRKFVKINRNRNRKK